MGLTVFFTQTRRIVNHSGRGILATTTWISMSELSSQVVDGMGVVAAFTYQPLVGQHCKNPFC
jgi:hypothetical protein